LGLHIPDRRSFLFEYDRGTENRSTLTRKFRWYEDGIPGFPYAAVLVVADAAARLENVRQVLRLAGERPISGCLLSDLATAGIEGKIFMDLRGRSGLCTLAEFIS